MKKTLALTLSILLFVSFFSCGKKPVKETDNTTLNNSNSQQQNASTENNSDTKSSNDQIHDITPNNWGVTDRFSADNDKPSESFYINFPYFGGVARGYGLGANQGDDTTVFVFGQNDYSPTIKGIDELFPSYFEQVKYTLEKTYGLRASNFALSLSDNASVKIGDYDMHTFIGEIAFDLEGKPQNYNFVAYATTLKSNGAYAYWVVYDTSDKQSNGELIAQHALNMAKTFREEK